MTPHPWWSLPRTRPGPLADILSAIYCCNRLGPEMSGEGFNKSVDLSATGLNQSQSCANTAWTHICCWTIWVPGPLSVYCNVQCAFLMFRLQDICLQELSIRSGYQDVSTLVMVISCCVQLPVIFLTTKDVFNSVTIPSTLYCITQTYQLHTV